MDNERVNTTNSKIHKDAVHIIPGTGNIDMSDSTIKQGATVICGATKGCTASMRGAQIDSGATVICLSGTHPDDEAYKKIRKKAMERMAQLREQNKQHCEQNQN